MKYIAFLLAAMASPVSAQTMMDNQVLSAGHYTWTDSLSQDHLSVKVNLRTQMAYVYSGDDLVGETSVSTGRDGFETKVGHFTVLGKEENHFSKKYKANMPWTMWFTTDGEALHAGGNPGGRSSHGCVHMPMAFVTKLYTMMKIGDTVDIVDEEPDLFLNLQPEEE